MTAHTADVPPTSAGADLIAQTIAAQGWCVMPDFVDTALLHALAAESELLWQARNFREARIGTGRTLAQDAEIRGDFILWLDNAALTPAQQGYTAQLDALRQTLNRQIFLGAFDTELHLARYPAGARYHKHLDRHAGSQARLLSCILYLNQDWVEEDGGQLRLYLEPTRTLDVLPRGGTLVTFLSGDYYHEVLPARRARLSITGWMRARG